MCIPGRIWTGFSPGGNGMAAGNVTTVLYVAKDLRSTELPTFGLQGAALDRAYPPCIWVRWESNAIGTSDSVAAGKPPALDAIPAWRLTPALLAHILRQTRAIDAKIASGAMPPDKIALALKRFDRIMAWAERAFEPGATLREMTRQRREAFVMAPPLSRSHTPQMAEAMGWDDEGVVE